MSHALASRLAICLAVSALAAAPARAELPPLTADLGYVATVVPARQLDLVSAQDHLAVLHLGAGVSVPVARAFVDLEAAFTTGSTAANAHAGLSTSLWMRGLDAGARLRYPWKRWLEPYVKVSAGWDWATLTLLSEAQLTQTVGAPGASGLLGVQLPLPLGKGVARQPTLVLDLGVGYALRPGFRFDAMGPTPPAKAPPDPIAQGTVNVGTLPVSGISYRITVALRY